MHNEHLSNHEPEDPRHNDAAKNAFHHMMTRIAGHQEANGVYDWQKTGHLDGGSHDALNNLTPIDQVPATPEAQNGANFGSDASDKTERTPKLLIDAMHDAAKLSSNKAAAQELPATETRQDVEDIEWLNGGIRYGDEISAAIPKKAPPPEQH